VAGPRALCLTIRPRRFAVIPIKTILFPTDFSPQAEYVFPLACAMARDYGARLILLHVKPLMPILYGDAVLASPESPEMIENLREQLRRLGETESGVCVEPEIREGEPANEILAAVREEACDLIVMGTHGRTGVGRLLLGSVAEQVVRKAHCPVLTMKMPVQATVPAAELTAAVPS